MFDIKQGLPRKKNQIFLFFGNHGPCVHVVQTMVDMENDGNIQYILYFVECCYSNRNKSRP